MKNTLKAILIVVLIVAVLIGCYALYRSLSGRYAAAQKSAETAAPTVAPAAAETAAPQQTPAPAATPAPTAAREDAPDFTIYDADGKAVSLSDLAGKPVVVNMWTSWCSFCKSELPDFQKAYETYGSDVVFLMINLTGSDTREDADALIQSKGYTFPVYYDLDGSAAGAFSVRSIPMSVFITADGKLADMAIGAVGAAELDNYIAEILPAA